MPLRVESSVNDLTLLSKITPSCTALVAHVPMNAALALTPRHHIAGLKAGQRLHHSLHTHLLYLCAAVKEAW